METINTINMSEEEKEKYFSELAGDPTTWLDKLTPLMHKDRTSEEQEFYAWLNKKFVTLNDPEVFKQYFG